MKSSKTFRSILALLIFVVTLGFSFPAFAAPDPNSITITYTWKNSDSDTTAFPSVSQHFAEGQRYTFIHVSKVGYTIDNNNSFLAERITGPHTASYAQMIATIPNATNIDNYLDIANETGYFAGTVENGRKYFFNTTLIPNDETVTVNYVSSDGKKLDSKTIDTKFSRTITIDQPSFDGYTIAANQPSSYKVDKDAAGANVVTVTYDPATSSSSESSSSSSSNGSSSSSSNSSNVASSSVSGSSSSSSSVTSNSQSSAASQSNSQSSNDQSIVATLVKEDSSSNNSSNTPTQQTSKHDASHHASLPSTSAIGYTTSVIGIIILASVTTLFVIKKRNH